jgi:replicative DNA helicase
MLEHGSPTPSLLRAAILDGMERYGYEWVVVDSASKMEYSGASSIYDITRGVSNGLQSLWQELDVPMIVTTQVGRDVGERPAGKKMPQIEDGYGGGVIEHNAGVVLGLYNHNYYVEMGTEQASDAYPPDTAVVRILKNRWRGDARTTSIRLKYVGGVGFYELQTNVIDLGNL